MTYFAPIDFQILPKEQKTVFIDLAVAPPEGYYAQLMSKSGLTVLYELESEGWGKLILTSLANMGVVLKNNSDQPIERLAGEQIAQLLFIKVATPTLIQVTSLAKTERGRIWLRGTHQLTRNGIGGSDADCKYC